MLQPDERAVLTGMVDPAQRKTPTTVLPEWFESQVAHNAAAVAVICGNDRLTYGDLNRRANRLAHLLIGMGVGPESLVGVSLDRCLDMVVAICAIQKAGGAYVPLDPEYPKARLEYMVGDAAPAVILTAGDLNPAFAGSVLALDSTATAAALARMPAHNPSDADRRRPLHPDHPAYVIYTSGSTGEPKGCVITHRNVVRLFGATGAWFNFGPADVWTLFHSYAFDFSVWELWGALLHGGRLVVVPKRRPARPPSFSPCWPSMASPCSTRRRRHSMRCCRRTPTILRCASDCACAGWCSAARRWTCRGWRIGMAATASRRRRW